MIGLDELVRRVAGLDRGELLRWVENRWVLPEVSLDRRWRFREIDVARVELILDIRRDFVIDDEAMPLVLALLDQVYGLRRQLRRLCEAIEQQPPAIRAAIANTLPPAGDGGEP